MGDWSEFSSLHWASPIPMLGGVALMELSIYILLYTSHLISVKEKDGGGVSNKRKSHHEIRR